MRRWLPLVWGALISLACAEPPPALEHEGDPCRTLDELCVGDASVLHCEEGRWALTSCDERCAMTGPGLGSLGCEVAGSGEESCVCEPPVGGCEPGMSSCLDDELLELCTADWQWSSFDCAQLCTETSTPVSLGCAQEEGEAWCSCTFEGASCADESPRCVDAQTLGSCEAGTWTHFDCVELCGQADAQCAPVGPEGPACDCG